MKRYLLIAMLLLCQHAQANNGDAQIINYFRYSPTFASSGQPTEQQLTQLRDDGLKRVVYIAYSDHERSLANEDRIAKRLGLDYIHIPVEWSAPTVSDFELFASVMQQDANKPTLLHCQMNFRATAFALLYRVIYEDVPVSKAKAEMNSVWTPNETWTKYIISVLQAADIDPYCAGCDWTPSKPQH